MGSSNFQPSARFGMLLDRMARDGEKGVWDIVS